MKYINVPKPVVLSNTLTNEPLKFQDENGNVLTKEISFAEFMFQSVLNDENHFGKNMDQIESCLKIRTQIRLATGKDGNGIVALEDGDYKLLLEALKTPTKPFIPDVVCQCYDFISAVKEASGNILQ